MTLAELINDTTIPFEARKTKLTKLLRAKKLTEDEEKITVSAAMRAMKRLKKKDLLGPLTMEEGASIHIYTQESQLYKNLNSNMRDRVSCVCLHVCTRVRATVNATPMTSAVLSVLSMVVDDTF